VPPISSSPDDLEFCAGVVREHDPDRYFSALFAPEERRRFLIALYAFNYEIARIGETVREPMLGEIRLAWWREALEGARAGTPRPHHVARALAQTFVAIDLPQDLFDAMIDARQFDLLDGTFEDAARRDAYVDATSGNVMRLASRILGGEARFDDLAREAGTAYGLTGLLRNRAIGRGRSFIGDNDDAAQAALAHLSVARRMAKPKRALPAFLPATLVPIYLRDPRKDVSIHRRQIALLGASLRGRI
jgi:15-cis-phytoene synthase